MKAESFYDLNRSVHLGRRDAFLEKAFEVFPKCRRESSGNRRMQHVDAALYYLQAAFDHSVLAARSTHALPEEESFVLAVRPLLFHFPSLIAVMENESRLKDSGNAFGQFIKKHGQPLEATDMACNSGQLLEGISLFFQLIESLHIPLRKKISERMNEQEKVRYKNSCRDLKKHISTRRHQRHAVRHGQIFGPALLEQYESK